VRGVDETGEATSRLAAHPQLFAGDRLTATIDAATELYVYVGKGRTLVGPWGTGTTDFIVTPTFE
jgi:hypothetical protein